MHQTGMTAKVYDIVRILSGLLIEYLIFHK